jgi:hypothetical protein
MDLVSLNLPGSRYLEYFFFVTKGNYSGNNLRKWHPANS